MAAQVAAPSIEDQADTLDKVITLATTFSTCVEAFGLIHASKSSERPQKLALTKLGIQQGRLLIFGDVVGISSPPRSIATHMIPSRPGALNPDPNEPVNFGERDPRLDDPAIRRQIEAALNEILDRPASLPRAAMMEQFGLKPPKKPSPLTESALDTTRLEAFREKYGLLQDLHGGLSLRTRRGMSMTTTHWNVSDVGRFEAFVGLVRGAVDALIALLGVRDKVDRALAVDIKAMGWHPDLNGAIVRRDWEKLHLIAEACRDDYPGYVASTRVALDYLNRTWKEVDRPPTVGAQTTTAPSISIARAPAPVPVPVPKPKPQGGAPKEAAAAEHDARHAARPNWLRSLFSSGGSGQDKDKLPKSLSHAQRRRQLSVAPAATTGTGTTEAPRSKSVDVHAVQLFDDEGLTQQRSKSLSATQQWKERQQERGPEREREQREQHRPDPDPEHKDGEDTGAARPDSPQEAQPATIPSSLASTAVEAPDAGGGGLSKVDTVNSLIERRDQFQGLGRTETKQLRELAHGWR